MGSGRLFRFSRAALHVRVGTPNAFRHLCADVLYSYLGQRFTAALTVLVGQFTKCYVESPTLSLQRNACNKAGDPAAVRASGS